MRIRSMTSADVSAAAMLYQSANQFTTKKNILIWTRRGLNDSPEFNFVAENRAGVIGSVSATFVTRSMLQIEDIAVAENERGKGIGTMLTKHLLKTAESRSVRKVRLWIHWKNAAAIPFYHRLGFSITKALKTQGIPLVPDGEEIIVMERKL